MEIATGPSISSAPQRATCGRAAQKEERKKIIFLAFVILGDERTRREGEEKSALDDAARAAQVQTFPQG